MLSAVAAINLAVDMRNHSATFEALADTDACVPNLDEPNSDKYQSALEKAKQAKQEVMLTSTLNKLYNKITFILFEKMIISGWNIESSILISTCI